MVLVGILVTVLGFVISLMSLGMASDVNTRMFIVLAGIADIASATTPALWGTHDVRFDGFFDKLSLVGSRPVIPEKSGRDGRCIFRK